MTATEIEAYFPRIKGSLEITSEPDEEYNCIAWSVNDKKQWWWPTPPGHRRWPGKYWLDGIPHEETIPVFTEMYQRLAFEVCDSSEYEENYDKIAIYADSSGIVTHAARWWKDDGGWSSKLGEENDILHHHLAALESASYGKVRLVMRRKRRSK